MSKKNRKSLFAWCIRTLAVSLVPTLILVSCASDSNDGKVAADTTAPTASTTLIGSTIVGTNNLTVTFSEVVTGVSGNETDGTCDATKTVKLTNYAGTCYGMTILAVGNVYTINPKTDLISGSYTLTLGAGIKDAAGNALTESAISFTVDDAKTTVAANLTTALSGVTGSSDIVSAVSTALSADNVTNSLSSAIPVGYEAAIKQINTMGDADYVATLTKVLESLFGNFQALSTAASRSTAATDDDDERATAAKKIAVTTAKEAKSEHFEAVQAKAKTEGLRVVSDAKKGETLKNMDDGAAAAILNDSSLTAAQKQAKLETNSKASATAVTANVSKTYSAETAKKDLNTAKDAVSAKIDENPDAGVDKSTYSAAADANIAATESKLTEAETNAAAEPDPTKPVVVTPPTVALTASSTSVNEGDSSLVVNLTATQSATASKDTTITLATSGTADSSDYTLASNTITIAAGSTTGTATLTILNDSDIEATESVTVEISGISGGDDATESGNQAATISIVDNDVAPTVTLSASSTSVNEGDSSLTVTLTATLSAAATEKTTVTLSTSGGTAGSDFTLASSTIEIAAGATTGTTTLTILNDTTAEVTETVTVAVSTVSGGDNAIESGTQTAAISIVDNDQTVSIALSGQTTIAGINNYYTTRTPNFTITNSNSASVTLTAVTSSNCPSTDITVAAGSGDYSLGDFGAIAVAGSTTTKSVSKRNMSCSFTVNSQTVITPDFSIDFSAPQLTSVSVDTADNSTSKVIQLDLNTLQDDWNGDGSKTTAYYIKDNSDNSTSSAAPTASATGWINVVSNFVEGNSVENISYTLTDTDDNETKIISVFLKDKANNVSTATQTTFRLGADSNQPTLTSMMIRDVGTNVDNATFTDNETVKLVIEAADAQSGVRYVIVTDNSTVANQIDNGTRGSKTGGALLDNLTNSTFLDGTQVIKSDNSTNFLSDNGSQIIVTGAFISNLTSGSKQLWSWVADGAKNISDNVTAVSAAGYAGSDSIYLDSVSPTATIVSMIAPIDNLTNIDNQTFTDNDTVTIVLAYNDNGTAQYYISETNTAPSQYVDNISGAMNDNTYRDQFTSGFARDNVTQLDNGSMADNLTKSVWSILDNGTGDNASTYTVSDNWTGNNQTITYKLSAGDGLKTVYVWVKDAANRISQVANDNITRDETGPAKNSNNWDINSGSTATDNLTVVVDNVSLFTDAGVGLHRLYFNDNTTKPTAALFDRIPNAGLDNLTYTFFDNGSNRSPGDTLNLYIWAVDNLSNISDNYTTASIIFDNSSPTAGDNATITNAAYTSDNQTFFVHGTSVTFGLTGVGTDNTTMTYLVTDDDNATRASNATSNFTSDASNRSYFNLAEFDNKTLYVWAKDVVGNVSSNPVDNLTVKVDNTAPVFNNLTLVAHDNGTGTLFSVGDDNLTIMFDNVTDNFSGVYAYYISTADNYSSTTSTENGWTTFSGGSDNVTITVPALGNHQEGVTNAETIYVTLIDNGRRASSTQTLTINSAEDNPVAGDNSTSGIIIYNDNTTNTSSYSWASDNGSTDNATGSKVTVQIKGTDSTVVTSYYITESSSEKPTASSVVWSSLTNPAASVSENVTYTIQSTPDNNTALNLYVWVRDNSSNISDNYSFDNITYYR